MMLPGIDWLLALPWMLGLACIAWLVATLRGNAGLVDIFWPLFLLLAASHTFATSPGPGTRAVMVLVLVAVWALRLAVHLLVRNWNAPEDRRYQAIRARNQPGFWWKSLYLVFALQAVLAFVVSAPLYAAISAPDSPPGWPGLTGALLAAGGILYEAIADHQLKRFKADPAHRGEVMDRGLWRFSRHPNYFGEFCTWWGLFLIAASVGAWWSLVSPLLMSLLLLRITGMPLLEKDLRQHRPAYAAYMARTNAFFPGPRRPA